MKTANSHPIASLCLLIALWWFGLFALNIVSRKALVENGEESIVHEGLTTESSKLLWVELTSIQHITASVVAIAIMKLTRQQIKPSYVLCHKKMVCVAAICHLLGTLATNAAYTVVASDIAVLVRACQPLVTFLLSMKVLSVLDVSKFLSVTFIVIGAFTFVLDSTSLTLNIWGLVVATVSSFAFSGRNILLKEGNGKWDNTLEKFTVISLLSALFSLPLWCTKVAVTRTVFTGGILGVGGVLSCIINPACSFTSLKVLETVTPVTHAIITICIRLFSAIERFLVFAPVNFSSNIVFSLAVTSVGFYFYRLNNQHTKVSWLYLKIFSFFAFVSYLLILNPNFSMYESNDMPPGVGFQSMTSLRHAEYSEKSISTAWLYDSPISDDIVKNIGHLAGNNPTFTLYVYCGTAPCAEAVAALEKKNIVVGYAVISDIVKGTPLEKWVARHPINKLLAGREFENHLHQVTILGILWKYGGFYINPMVRREKGSLPKYQDGTFSLVSKEVTFPKRSLPSVFDVSYFSRNHHIIEQLAEVYVSSYPTANPFKFDFMDAVWKIVLRKCGLPCFDHLYNGDQMELSRAYANNTSHFGILLHSVPEHSRDDRLMVDEIEDLAGLQYLPYVDFLIQRENLRSFSSSNNVTAFLNGKWGVSGGKYLALKSLNPIMLSVHLASGVKRNWSEHLNYLRAHEPIGCRDFGTMKYLKANGIEAFSPSSLMLLMKNPNPNLQQTRDRVYFTESNGYVHLLPPKVQGSAIDLRKEVGKSDTLMPLMDSYRLVEKFASAKIVITGNLQYALTCVALETPVIYLSNSNEDGPPVSAVKGLLPHVVDMNAMTEDEVRKWFQNFYWENTSHTPNPSLLMRLRATSWKVIRQNQHLYDTARRFGVVPMSPPLSLQHQNKLVFYLVFSTSKHSSLSITWSLKKQSGRFNWRHWRSIESIFYHHPTAQVKVYSNTLPNNTFDVLTEAGYLIQVQRYTLENLLLGTPAEGFIKKLRKARKGSFWYANTSDLLRVLLVYQYGGIYMDTDIYIVRSLHHLKMNSIGWQDYTRGTMNGAFFKFEKGNLFLQACLKDYVKNYNGAIWAHNGPKLLTRVYRASTWSNDVVNVVDYELFYMIDGGNMNQQCFTDTQGNIFDKNMKILNTEAFVFHMNSKISGYKGIAGDRLKNGTICKHLLNSYCVLCDLIH